MRDVAFDLAAFRRAYSRFLTPDRVLLTGHSHQAWPDVVRDALDSFFDDSARFVDEKWSEAIFPKLDRVGRKILVRMGFDENDSIAFGKSTHELVYRLLTCLPGAKAARVVTTRSEFHSLYRQLTRLEEAGLVEVVWVDSQPRERLAERLLASLEPGVAMLALSAVLFEDAYVVPRMGEILARATALGAIPLVDAYHAFNVVPIDWGAAQSSLFVTAGSYKYAGFGEGLCWLRIPTACDLRPIYTGWFADFGSLASPRTGRIEYGSSGARFSGATFDASSVYRAEAALGHWDRFGLDVPALRAISTRQTSRIANALDAAGLGTSLASAREAERRGGFVAVRHPNAIAVAERLRARHVFVDARGDLVRLGPAPYLTDDEIDRGVAAAVEELRAAG
jgi:selenocysteine lyase/cysteine desulfurase